MTQTEITKALQEKLFKQMVDDGQKFAAFMNGHSADYSEQTVLGSAPRKLLGFIPLGEKTTEKPEQYWVIREPKHGTHEGTNYGGFPLWWTGSGIPGKVSKHDVFQRLVINRGGALKCFVSFGEEVKGSSSTYTTSSVAKPDDFILRSSLVSETFAGSLRGIWLRDLVTAIQVYTSLEPDVSMFSSSDPAQANAWSLLPGSLR